MTNHQNRIQALKEILLKLHDGAAPESVQEDFNHHFTGVSAIEISLMEHELMSTDTGINFQDVMRLCNVHANLFKDAIDPVIANDMDHPGHPVFLFKAENQALQACLIRISRILTRIQEQKDLLQDPDVIRGLQRQLALLDQFKIHYKRKEEVLFAHMERYGHDAPPKVMWGVDDDIRDLFDRAVAISQSLSATNLPDFIKAFKEFQVEFEEMIFKEEQILLNIFLEIFSQEDWYQIAQESQTYGYAIIRPNQEWHPQNVSNLNKPRQALSQTEAPKINEQKNKLDLDPNQHSIQVPGGQIKFEWIPDQTHPNLTSSPDQMLPLNHGNLNLKQIDQIFRHLPMEISFVNKDNIFQYFNDLGKEGQMILKRVPSQIGRTIEECHPPRLVAMVTDLISDFAHGRRDRESLWYQKGKQMILITYIALRDDQGDFLGVLELVQDIQPYLDLAGTSKTVISPLDTDQKPE
ncbi:DUF438 domain-containing protein [Eremococcus coleocola]|uniref:Hemerythrin HHE cation binding domain protein n=1 Tax=Eremococcus coleocola ACS-139-V-Col8 TaxID=908337 RepID=E4KPF8_9LACT|nr:DUF438 domain-containing protein [Eremococcus coleocola]EFR31228.1 hemerythrin HHE cation binding domain protein [Eremococcus coleocola ACS-139-V-Col8]